MTALPPVPFPERDRRLAAALAGDREALAAVLADPDSGLSSARLQVLLARTAEDAEPPLAVPAAVRALRARTAATWMLVERDLQDLGAALGAAGVPWAPIKGADVATRHDPSLYGDPTGRAMTDIDLLVPEAAYRRAREALEADGWVNRAPGARFERYVQEEGSAWTGGRAGSPLVVELHLRLWGFVPEGMGDELVERAGVDPALGPTARRLRLADAFLLAAVHPWLHLPPRSLANWWELHRMAELGGSRLIEEVAAATRRWGLELPVLLSSAQVAALWPGGGGERLVERLRGRLRRSERFAARRALSRPPGEASIELVAAARLFAGRPSRSGGKPIVRRVWAHPGIVERLTPEGWSWPRRRAVHVLQCLGLLPAPRADWWRAPTHGHRAHREPAR